MSANTELLCMNTLCKPTDPAKYCGCCGEPCEKLGIYPDQQPYKPGYCQRCGHKMQAFDKQIIDQAISRAEETPIGERISFGKVLYGEESQ